MCSVIDWFNKYLINIFVVMVVQQDNVPMRHLLQNLQLPIFIFFILVHMLYRDLLIRFIIRTYVLSLSFIRQNNYQINAAKCSISNNLYIFVLFISRYFLNYFLSTFHSNNTIFFINYKLLFYIIYLRKLNCLIVYKQFEFKFTFHRLINI
jgi:hypothetical protein